MADIPELGKAAAEARAADPEDEMAEPDTADGPEVPELMPCETAFLIFVAKDDNGIPRYMMTEDINAPLVPEHQASLDEVLAAMRVVESDIESQKTAVKAANITIGQQMQLMQQARQQQESQMVQQQIARDRAKAFTGGRSSGR